MCWGGECRAADWHYLNRFTLQRKLLIQKSNHNGLDDYCAYALNIWTRRTSIHTKSIQLGFSQRSGRNSCCFEQAESRHALVWRDMLDGGFIKQSKINRGSRCNKFCQSYNPQESCRKRILTVWRFLKKNPTPNPFEACRLNKVPHSKPPCSL